MRAIVYDQYGPANVLHLGELAAPKPRAGEVLIRVRAAEATKADCEMRSFHLPVKWYWLPLRLVMGIRKPRRPVLGSYFAGVIEAVGEGVSSFERGDEVFGSTGLRMGSYGEYLTLPASATLAPKPRNLSFEEAAAVPLGGLNALHFMRRARIKSGDRVLINGAGGSIGTFAVQLAKAMGAEVTAVDRASKQDMLRSIGADHFIDYQKERFTEIDQTYDVIFDMVVDSPYGKCLGRLNPNGRYLLGNPRLSKMLRSSLTTRFTDKRVLFAFAREKVEELRELGERIERGEIQVPLDGVFPLERASEAHRRVETEARVGAVVISHSPAT